MLKNNLHKYLKNEIQTYYISSVAVSKPPLLFIFATHGGTVVLF